VIRWTFVSAQVPMAEIGSMRERPRLVSAYSTRGGGGAGSLVVDGARLVDQPGFPEAYRPEALVMGEALDYLRGLGNGVSWTYLSPAPLIQPGERTGTYRTGDDSPVGDAISAEDYAVALLDEIEEPAHPDRRFTVAN
jgi:putative NADH-flavin reductase